jgi:hypothetical protein
MNVFLKKNILGVYLNKYFSAKMAFSVICKPKNVLNCLFFCAVFVIFGRLGVYLPPLTPSTTTPFPGTPPLIVSTPSSF